jgi:hypothetical protein
VLEANGIRVEPMLGPTRGGTLVNVEAGVAHCGACPLPQITFGGVPATEVVALDPDSFRARTPPHAAGAVEVRVTSQDRSVAAYAFRYYDPAEPALANLFTRLLVPVFLNSAGVASSRWSTEVWARNRNEFAVEIWNGPSIPASMPLALPLREAPNGVFLHVPRDAAARLHLNAVVRNEGRSGTELPIVREEDFREEVELLGIPADARFRHQLRIYAPAPSTVVVTAYDLGTGVADPGRLLTLSAGDAPDAPAFATLTNLRPAATRPFGVRVQAFGPPVWAFVSITDNVTGEVRIVSAQ